MAGADSDYNFLAAWSHSCNDEQLVLVLPDGLTFLDPKSRQLKSDKVKKSYSCVAWLPCVKGKADVLIAARLNCIDLLDARSGSVLATTDCRMESTEDNECKQLYQLPICISILQYNINRNSH
jgi:hypothetical protein